MVDGTKANKENKLLEKRNKYLYNLIFQIEEELDELNMEKGNLCIYCDSKEYDGINGIVHKNDCLIIKLRKCLKEQSK